MEEHRKALRGILSGMISRCYNVSFSNRKTYDRYGALGVRVSEHWMRVPEDFVSWALENGYTPGLQIDRIDPDGNYTPSNCRFVTPRENSLNKRPASPMTQRKEYLLRSYRHEVSV